MSAGNGELAGRSMNVHGIGKIAMAHRSMAET